MRAITLWRPWLWAIFSAPRDRLKDVENRSWAPEYILGETVALHAGKHVAGREVFDSIERVCGVRPPEDGGPTGIVGVVRFDAMVRESTSPWFFGPIGWEIGMRQVLVEPIPCRGYQGIWTVPPEVEAHMRAQLAKPTRRRGGK